MKSVNMRDNKFDFYKAVLIIGVVWGHVINHMVMNDNITIAIHQFFRTYDMPFFMVISGYFLKKSCEKKKLNNLLLNKVTTILGPSVLWSLLLSRFHSVSEYYFLNAVFFSSVIVICSNAVFTNDRLRNALLVIVSAVFYFVRLPLCNMSYLYPFFVLGYAFPGLWDLSKRARHNSVVFFIFVLCLCFWTKDYNIWNAGSYIPNGGGGKLLLIIAFRMTIAFVGILSVKWLCDVFYEYLSNHNSGLMNIILEIGRETFGIYILHCFALIIVSKVVAISTSYYGYNCFTVNESLFGYIIAPIIAIFIVITVLLVIRMMKKNKYSKLLLGFRWV